MARKKKPEIKHEVKITATCHFCNAINEVDKYDFDFWSEPCEICGSHSSLDLSFTCKECGNIVEHNLYGS